MPIFGLYLLKNYLKVLFLCVGSFISILLVSRLEEIAYFASLGAPLSYLWLFTLYQIPYILPIAIPVSCLISTITIFQRLSHTHELTALRAGGFSLKQIASPIIFASALIALVCFYITSELATTCHLSTRKMVYDLSSVNPLILLQSAKIAKLKGSYFQMDPVQNGKMAKNLLIALKNQTQDRLTLALAKSVALEEGQLIANQISIISNVTKDHFFIENQQKLTASSAEFAHLLRSKGWKIANDHLKFSLLRARKKLLSHEKQSTAKCHSEIIRRFTLAISNITFTLMGISFGIQISRNRLKRKILWVLSLTTLSLVAFFAGKEFDHLVWIAALLFLFPHFVIAFFSLWTLSHINRGIE